MKGKLLMALSFTLVGILMIHDANKRANAGWRSTGLECRTGTTSVTGPNGEVTTLQETFCWSGAEWVDDNPYDVIDVFDGGYDPEIGEVWALYDSDYDGKMDCFKNATNSPSISSPYGYSSWRTHNWHFGTDITSGLQNYGHGAPIRAIASGVVGATGTHSGNGNFIRVDHSDGYSSYYFHLNSIDVSVGTPTFPGGTIGTMNCTGSCYGGGVQNSITGTHLHMEIRTSPSATRDTVNKSTTIDPAVYAGSCQ